jgi:hypothetical protein
MHSDYWLVDSNEGKGTDKTSHWVPEELEGFLQLENRMQKGLRSGATTPDEAFLDWKSGVLRTAGRCPSPNSEPGSNTAQLVIGRVQAGKTSSFTGLIRLLADNSYNLFIVIAGTSTNLRDQTFSRLSKDLSGQDDIEVLRTGDQFDPKKEADRLLKRLRRWGQQQSDTDFLNFNDKKIVYVALKSTKAHLDSILEMLKLLRATAEGTRLLEGTPSLIIDDEADQASPNGRAASENSSDVTAVYSRLSELRKLLKKHAFVGYTATPYANVLMGVASEIRPHFITVLEPGADYTGAIDLFHTDQPYARTISDFDESEELPESLKLAFALFICQLTIFHCSDRAIKERYFLEPFLSNPPISTATMLVHADRLVRVSGEITNLLRALQNYWSSIFNNKFKNSEYVDVAEEHLWVKYFEPALLDLESGVSIKLPRDLFRRAVRELIGEVEILKIVGQGDDFPSDGDNGNKPRWSSRFGWVLIGGQLLDRGQTLPNLINTYMPRSPGGGASAGEIGGQFDTLQQRGRFYGHRRTYRPILRGWFDERTLDTYMSIAISEIQHFELLAELDNRDANLSKESILLDTGPSSKLRLVRKSVLGQSVLDVSSSIWLGRQLRYDNRANANNHLVLKKFLEAETFSEVKLKGSNKNVRSNWSAIVSAHLILDFLNSWMFSPSDKAHFEAAKHVIRAATLAGESNLIDLVLMSRNSSGKYDASSHGEYRSTDPTSISESVEMLGHKIKQLPSSNDANYVSDTRITVQVHFLDVVSQKGSIPFVKDAVGLAISSPKFGRSVFRGAIVEA